MSIDTVNPLAKELADYEEATKALAEHRLFVRKLQTRRDEVALAVTEAASRAARQPITADLSLEAIKASALARATAGFEMDTLQELLAEIDTAIAVAINKETALKLWSTDSKTAIWQAVLENAVNLIDDQTRHTIIVASYMLGTTDQNVMTLIRGPEYCSGVDCDQIIAVEQMWQVPV